MKEIKDAPAFLMKVLRPPTIEQDSASGGFVPDDLPVTERERVCQYDASKGFVLQKNKRPRAA